MFERFTTQGRATVVRAQDEALQLRHGYIGTEHILLSLLNEGSGIPYRVLHEAGVDRAQVREAIVRTVGVGASSPDTGDEHLGDEDAQALQAIGIDLPTVRAKIEELFGPGALDPPCPPPRRGLLGRRKAIGVARIPFTARSKKVLELSLREAVRLGHSYLGTEHILLGLLREGKGLAAMILVEAGLTLDDLRVRTMAALDQAA